MEFTQLEREAARYLPQLTQRRRALHRMPEGGYAERKTQAYIMETLAAMNPDDLRAFADTGVRAVFRGDGTGRSIAFRADMDALPVAEETGLPFASEHPGMMHACGHDGHMANLLTLAEWLRDNRASLRDTVTLLFQPAEETTGGAKRMIDEGALRNPDVEAVYGMHMMPDVPRGMAACCAGPMMAQTCEMDVVITGRSAHGATPHLGVDAVAAMGHLLTLMQTSVARQLDPGTPALLTIGRVEAGTQRNVLAQTARLEGIARTLSNRVYERLEERILADIRAVDAAFGTQTEFVRRVFYPCGENDAAEFARVRGVLGDRLMPTAPRMIAEDFSYYQLSVPGVFVFCGCMDETHSAPLHACTFDFDETALVTGLALFIGLIARR